MRPALPKPRIRRQSSESRPVAADPGEVDLEPNIGLPLARSLLTTYLVLLLLVPSNLTIGALGSMGRPATLWGLVCLSWWFWATFTRPRAEASRPQPVRTAYLVFLSVVLAAYALAHARGMPPDEVSPSDSAVLRTASWGGALLLANDGLAGIDDLIRLLRRFAAIVGVLAVLGLAQFVTGSAIVDAVPFPGLSVDTSLSTVDLRGEFTRSSGTSTHPLEYAVVLTTALPIAIALALHSTRGLVRRWWAVAAIGVASTVSISRSALLGLAVGILVLVPAMGRRARAGMAVSATLVLVGTWVVVPGLLGTIRGLFLSVGSDNSTTSRIGAAEAAQSLVSANPLLGRGLGTFLPKYFILDNALLGMAIELGIIGLISFLSIVAAGIVQAQVAKRNHGGPPVAAMLPQALTASLAAVTTLFLFFDALAFTMSATLYFLLAGLAGGLANVRLGEPDRRPG